MSKTIAFFTICSNNYLPYAQILLQSIQKFYPGSSLYLCLADIKLREIDLDIEGLHIIEAKDLKIPDFSDLAFRYDVMEFNTALKPFMMSLLIEEYNYDYVVYLDPDIEVFAPLTAVFELLDHGYNFVLTPHLTKPAEINAYPNDVDIMKAGIYNLGFIAVSNHTDVYYFLHWWSRRLRFQCINQQDQGIFVDQKFVDLLPAFFENVAILRNTALNVAYWNLDQRNLIYDESQEIWLVDGKPLVFFHFSGINPKNRYRLSKHTSRFNENLNTDLQLIIDHYIEQYKKNASANYLVKKYHYNYFDNNILIPSFIKYYYRNLGYVWTTDPFKSFSLYLNEVNLQVLEKTSVKITNLMYALWSQRQDLIESYTLDTKESVYSYLRWFIQYAYIHNISEYFIMPALKNICEIYSFNETHDLPLRKLSKSQNDLIAIIGYLKAEIGVGQAARSVARSFDSLGMSVQALDVDINVTSRRDDSSVDYLLQEQINSPIHIYKINADQFLIVKDYIANQINDNSSYQICMPAWELSLFPSEWVDNFSGINEVWAESEFVRAALQAKLTIPVYCMPPAIIIDNFVVQDRAFFELPEKTFLFHFNFDFASYSSRKNPKAVIAAYRKAFRTKPIGIDTALVIKVKGYDPNNQQLQQLLNTMQDEQDIIIINKQLSHSDSLALMNCCDCYVSLHRSEGFGYTLAEAMLLGKPVIATDFSGSREFLKTSTGFPIAYELVKLKEGDYPFYENQFWAEPDLDHAAWTMRQVIWDKLNTQKIALSGQDYIKKHHSLQAAGIKYMKRLQQLGIY